MTDKTVPKRADIATKYTWNSESVFNSLEAWGTELKAIQESLPEIEKYRHNLKDGPSILVEALHMRDEIMRRTFDLSNETCASECKQACFWMKNDNPTQQPLNKADFNETRYYNICGERCKFQLGKAKPFNKKVLITLSILGLVILFYLFILLKNRKYRGSSMMFILTTFLIVYVPILLFLSNFLSGYSLCDNLV